MDSKNIQQVRLIAIKIFLTVFLISAFFFKPGLTFVRFEFLTKALAHYGTTSIDKAKDEVRVTETDSLQFNGHTHIESAAGFSFIALTSYLPYSVFLKSNINDFRPVALLDLGRQGYLERL